MTPEELVDKRWGHTWPSDDGYREGLIEAIKLLRDYPLVVVEPGHAALGLGALVDWLHAKSRFLGEDDD